MHTRVMIVQSIGLTIANVNNKLLSLQDAGIHPRVGTVMTGAVCIEFARHNRMQDGKIDRFDP